MANINLFPTSSIGKKLVIAVTGICMLIFLVGHLAGNMLLFVSPEAFNTYAHRLTSNPLVYVAEAGLITIFLYHVGLAIKITLENRHARPMGYALRQSLGKSTLASSTMIWSGSIILVFLILHLIAFKFGGGTSSPEGVRDLYALVTTKFQDKLFSGFYVFCMIVLGFHLWHALQSSFRTLGFDHPKYTPWIKKISLITAILFTIGYSSFPVYFGFLQGCCAIGKP